MIDLGGSQVPVLLGVIDLILLWAFGGLVAAGAVAIFWDEIKTWATRVIELILGGLNAAIEVASTATVHLVKRGVSIFKQVRTYIRNVVYGETKLHTKEEVVYSVPDEIRIELDKKGEVLVMKTS